MTETKKITLYEIYRGLMALGMVSHPFLRENVFLDRKDQATANWQLIDKYFSPTQITDCHEDIATDLVDVHAERFWLREFENSKSLYQAKNPETQQDVWFCKDPNDDKKTIGLGLTKAEAILGAVSTLKERSEEEEKMKITMDAGVLSYLLRDAEKSLNIPTSGSTLELDDKIVKVRAEKGFVTLELTEHTRETWPGTIEHGNDFGDKTPEQKQAAKEALKKRQKTNDTD